MEDTSSVSFDLSCLVLFNVHVKRLSNSAWWIVEDISSVSFDGTPVAQSVECCTYDWKVAGLNPRLTTMLRSPFTAFILHYLRVCVHSYRVRSFHYVSSFF